MIRFLYLGRPKMFTRSVCRSTICLLWLILSLAPANAARFRVTISQTGQVSDLPPRVITMSCPDEGSCTCDLEIALSNTDHIPISVRVLFEPENAYFRFLTAQIDLAADARPFYHMVLSAGRGSAEIGLAFPTRSFAEETAHPGMVVPVFIPPFAGIKVDVHDEVM